jgi:hypothetical protein
MPLYKRIKENGKTAYGLGTYEISLKEKNSDVALIERKIT